MGLERSDLGNFFFTLLFVSPQLESKAVSNEQMGAEE